MVGRELKILKLIKVAMESSVEVCARFREELKKQFGFKDELKSTLCRHIQEMIYGRPFDFTNKEEYQAFLDAGGHSDTGCPKVCGIAAQVGAEKISKII